MTNNPPHPPPPRPSIQLGEEQKVINIGDSNSETTNENGYAVIGTLGAGGVALSDEKLEKLKEELKKAILYKDYKDMGEWLLGVFKALFEYFLEAAKAKKEDMYKNSKAIEDKLKQKQDAAKSSAFSARHTSEPLFQQKMIVDIEGKLLQPDENGVTPLDNYMQQHFEKRFNEIPAKNRTTLSTDQKYLSLRKDALRLYAMEYANTYYGAEVLAKEHDDLMKSLMDTSPVIRKIFNRSPLTEKIPEHAGEEGNLGNGPDQFSYTYQPTDSPMMTRLKMALILSNGEHMDGNDYCCGALNLYHGYARATRDPTTTFAKGLDGKFKIDLTKRWKHYKNTRGA